jgi:glycosyltransferase involved in cell wall biosynthesis
VKLALVTQQFAPRFEGGTELVVRAQARELARLGHEVRVIAGTDRLHGSADVESETVDGLSVRFVPRTSAEPYDFALERPRVARIVRELVAGAELVHVHHWATLHGALVRDLGSVRPVVVTLHDLFTSCPRFFRLHHPSVPRCPERGEFMTCARCCAPDAPGLALEESERALRARQDSFQAELDAAAALVVPSRSHAKRLLQHVDLETEKLTVVPHGLAAPLERVGQDWGGAGKLRVLHLGHRSHAKGVLDLVQALAALPDPARVELLLLGSEVEAEFDASLRREARGVAVKFLGGYERDTLATRVRDAGGAHLAALPSRAFESYGLVVDEALALGLSTWVSDRGAPKERVGDAGRVLPAADPLAWSRAFAEVLADPARLERERRAIPERLPTAAEAARALDEIYRSLALETR